MALAPDSGNQKPPKGLAAFAGELDGDGVCEFCHPGLQMLDLTLLLFHEPIFYPIKFGPYLGAQIRHLGTHLLDILLARGGLESFVDHLGKPFNGHLFLCRAPSVALAPVLLKCCISRVRAGRGNTWH